MEREIISFDNAIMGLLREEDNFDVLEGFFSELIRKPVTIQKLLCIKDDKSNPRNLYDDVIRIDLKAIVDDSEIAVFEIQYFDTWDIWRDIVFNPCRAIVEKITSGGELFNVKNIYSINIAIDSMNVACDYLFIADVNEFKGVHFNHVVPYYRNFKPLSNVPKDIKMEYFLIVPDNFKKIDKMAASKFDEWMYVLKNSAVKGKFTAAGIQAAGEKLDRIKKMHIQRRIDMEHRTYIFSAELNGRKIGRDEEKVDAAIRGFNKGHSIEIIADLTDLTSDQVTKILKDNELI